MAHNIAKRQKVNEMETGEEAILFNSDTLSKIISYLPSVDLLNLALTSTRLGISNNNEQSLIEESAYIAVHNIATEEQLAALPHYDGESSLADYHYLQLMRAPLTFDLLVNAEYVNSGDKSCVRHSGEDYDLGTAFSNNILRAGKHYTSFKLLCNRGCFVGIMRPGQANQNAMGSPRHKHFYQNFSRTHVEHNISSVQCCMYGITSGNCLSSGWEDDEDGAPSYNETVRWDGSESMSSRDELGMLLDLDEGTLSVYKNGRKLGVMKRGLVGPYCWVVTMVRGQVTIKRGFHQIEKRCD